MRYSQGLRKIFLEEFFATLRLELCHGSVEPYCAVNLRDLHKFLTWALCFRFLLGRGLLLFLALLYRLLLLSEQLLLMAITPFFWAYVLWLSIFKSRSVLSDCFLIIDNLIRPWRRELWVRIKSIDFCCPQRSVDKRILVSWIFQWSFVSILWQLLGFFCHERVDHRL